MTHFEYITQHLFPAWTQTWRYNFQAWADLMTNNYSPYKVNPDTNAEQECYDWFWTSIQLDDTYSKEFIEKIYLMVEDIESGKVKTIPYGEK